MKSCTSLIRETLNQGNGIYRLIPNFVPRRFSRPGKRLRLYPDDYFALGTKRGAIKERWFSSIINCMNGADTAPDEGLSYVACSGGMEDRFLLKDAVEELGPELLGEEMYQKYGTWPMYSKFFDFKDPLFHHLHLKFEDAARVNLLGKPEAYYYPVQYNNYPGNFPHTYFGFDPDITKEEVRERLLQFRNGDNRITEISRAYRIELGTGWYTPPGVLHAPGSYLTYEPQWNSDVNSVYENVTADEVNPYEQLVENCPDEKKEDIDYIMSLMDWEKNIDPNYRKTYFRPPITLKENEQITEKLIVYGNEYIAAKEVTVWPRQRVVYTDFTAFGCIFVQGRGKFGIFQAETPTLLHFGQQSADEYFVSGKAAEAGIEIVNQSEVEPLVFLAHFPYHSKCVPDTLSTNIGKGKAQC